MNRFNFSGYINKKEADLMREIKVRRDEKALFAKTIAEHLVDGVQDGEPKYLFLMMQLTFEIDAPALSFSDVAQFYYDNFTKTQLYGLSLVLIDPNAVKTGHYVAKDQKDADKYMEKLKKMKKENNYE